MNAILIAGLINIETNLQIEGFPIAYSPVRYPFFGVQTLVSGVGYNLAKALTTLGHPVRLLSLLGRDWSGDLVRTALAADGLADAEVITQLEQTPQSVILVDPAGRRQINTDLKDIQEQTYPVDRFAQALAGADLALLCNINFARPFLELARRQGVPIATDVHAIADLDDAYNRDFMAAAGILFMSDERLPCPPEEWARQLQERYATPIIVIGMGAQGALLAVQRDNTLTRLPAVTTRPIVSTIGAGDALFAAFIHAYRQSGDPYAALRKAMVFAAYKIGVAGGANGFLSAADLDALAAAPR